MVRALAAIVIVIGACGMEEPMGSTTQELYGRPSVLWPLTAGKATVRVCWLPPQLGGETFPVAAYAPDIAATLAERKAWARAIAESQWNASTPMDFEGWGDCDVMPGDVALQPIGSAFVTTCGGQGQSCVDALGTDLRGKGVVNLNLLFGDEVLYASRYEQSTVDGGYDPTMDAHGWWIPQACLFDFGSTWRTNSPVPRHVLDIFDPAVLADFMSIYENCVEYAVLHELGHVAGLAHEQYRPDDTAKRAACYAYEESIGITDSQPGDVATRYRGTRTLGPFDTESIMSYCRHDPSATFSPEDLQMMPVLYGLAPDPYDTGGCAVGGGRDDGVVAVLILLVATRYTPRKRRFPKFRSSSAA